jgi:hypothetical protein
MNDSENEMAAVVAVLLDRLHTTEDEELQAGLSQILDYAASLERRINAAIETLAL